MVVTIVRPFMPALKPACLASVLNVATFCAFFSSHRSSATSDALLETIGDPLGIGTGQAFRSPKNCSGKTFVRDLNRPEGLPQTARQISSGPLKSRTPRIPRGANLGIILR